eukprot:gene9207-biopygen9221
MNPCRSRMFARENSCSTSSSARWDSILSVSCVTWSLCMASFMNGVWYRLLFATLLSRVQSFGTALTLAKGTSKRYSVVPTVLYSKFGIRRVFLTSYRCFRRVSTTFSSALNSAATSARDEGPSTGGSATLKTFLTSFSAAASAFNARSAAAQIRSASWCDDGSRVTLSRAASRSSETRDATSTLLTHACATPRTVFSSVENSRGFARP